MPCPRIAPARAPVHPGRDGGRAVAEDAAPAAAVEAAQSQLVKLGSIARYHASRLGRAVDCGKSDFQRFR